MIEILVMCFLIPIFLGLGIYVPCWIIREINEYNERRYQHWIKNINTSKKSEYIDFRKMLA